MKNVLLYGWYNSCNLGDDAIFLTVTDYLKNNEINFKSITKYYNGIYFKHQNEDFTFIDDPLKENKNIKNKIIKRLLKVYNIISMLLNNKSENILKDYDAIIFVGGGYINSLWSYELVRICILILKAKLLHKKVILTGQTIGPFNSVWWTYLAKKFLKKADLILLREKFSYKLLQDFRFNNIKISADDVFLYNKSLRKTDCDDYIIINVKDFNGYDKIMEKFFELIISIQAMLDYKLVFIPFGIKKGPRNEKYMEFYKNKLKERNIQADFYIPDSLDQLYNKFYNAKLTIGMAYHCTTISLCTNTPTYAVYSGEYYKIKTMGVLAHYNLFDNALDIESAESEDIRRFSNYIISTYNNKEYLEKISNKSNELKELCKKNWDDAINII